MSQATSVSVLVIGSECSFTYNNSPYSGFLTILVISPVRAEFIVFVVQANDGGGVHRQLYDPRGCSGRLFPVSHGMHGFNKVSDTDWIGIVNEESATGFSFSQSYSSSADSQPLTDSVSFFF